MAGLYIHIPYCHSKCDYCDFYSTPKATGISEYVEAAILELKMRINEIREPIRTIYIGGGTPSILPMELLERLIKEGIAPLVDLEGVSEFTIEANPEDVTAEFALTAARLGINRVSLGVQSHDDQELASIGRRHDSATALRAIETLQKAGLTNLSCDLIYGIPRQSLKSWENSLERLLSLGLPHFSAYLLSYEKGTKLYARLISGKIEEASEELVSDMYFTLIDQARSCGYEHYEISNFARPGAQGVHNSNYWKGIPYLGIGAAAHSFDGNSRRFNPSNLKGYIEALGRMETFFVEEEESLKERYNDFLITRLRTAAGIDLKEMEKLWGIVMVSSFLKQSKPYLDSGKIIKEGSSVYIAEKHLLVSDAILRELILVED